MNIQPLTIRLVHNECVTDNHKDSFQRLRYKNLDWWPRHLKTSDLSQIRQFTQNYPKFTDQSGHHFCGPGFFVKIVLISDFVQPLILCEALVPRFHVQVSAFQTTPVTVSPTAFPCIWQMC